MPLANTTAPITTPSMKTKVLFGPELDWYVSIFFGNTTYDSEAFKLCQETIYLSSLNVIISGDYGY